MTSPVDLSDDDLRALVAAADTENAAAIVETLAHRINQLRAQNDELRIENVTLKRSGNYQNFLDRIQQQKNDLADLRAFADKHKLNDGCVAMIAAAGSTLLLPQVVIETGVMSLDQINADALAMLRPIYWTAVQRLGQMALMTSRFRIVTLSALSLPFSSDYDWSRARNVAATYLLKGEQVEALTALPDAETKWVVVCSRRGWVRALSWAGYEQASLAAQPIYTPKEADTPVWIGAGDASDLLLVTLQGRWLRLPLSAIDTLGSAALKLDPNDEVIGATFVNERQPIYVLGGDGAMVAAMPDAFEPHKKTGGKPAPLPNKIRPIACFSAPRMSSLMTLSRDGEIGMLPLMRVPLTTKLSDAPLFNLITRRLLTHSIY